MILNQQLRPRWRQWDYCFLLPARGQGHLSSGVKWACSAESERSPHRKGPPQAPSCWWRRSRHPPPLNKASASQSLHLPQFFWSQSFPNHCLLFALGLAGSPNPQQGLWGPFVSSFMKPGLMTAWTNPVHPSSPPHHQDCSLTKPVSTLTSPTLSTVPAQRQCNHHLRIMNTWISLNEARPLSSLPIEVSFPFL